MWNKKLPVYIYFRTSAWWKFLFVTWCDGLFLRFMSHRCENTCDRQLSWVWPVSGKRGRFWGETLTVNKVIFHVFVLLSLPSVFCLLWGFPSLWFSLDCLKNTNMDLKNWMVEATWTATQRDLLNSNRLSFTHYTIHPAAVEGISVCSCTTMINDCCCCCCCTIRKNEWEWCDSCVRNQSTGVYLRQKIFFRVVRKASIRGQKRVS